MADFLSIVEEYERRINKIVTFMYVIFRIPLFLHI